MQPLPTKKDALHYSTTTATIIDQLQSLGNDNNGLFKENTINPYINDPKFVITDNGITENSVFELWEKPYITNILSKSIVVATQPDPLPYELSNDTFSNICTTEPPPHSMSSDNYSNPGVIYPNHAPNLPNNEVQLPLYTNTLQDLYTMFTPNIYNFNQQPRPMFIPSTDVTKQQQSYASSSSSYMVNNNPDMLSMGKSVNMTPNQSSFSPNELWNQTFSTKGRGINNKHVENVDSITRQPHSLKITDYPPMYNEVTKFPIRKFSDPTTMSSYRSGFNGFNPQQNYSHPLYTTSDHHQSTVDIDPSSIATTAPIGLFQNENSTNGFFAPVMHLNNVNPNNYIEYGARLPYSLNNDVVNHLSKLILGNNNVPLDSNYNTEITFMDYIRQNDAFNSFNFSNNGQMNRFHNCCDPISPNYYRSSLVIGIHVNDLHELFNYNFKREIKNKLLLQISTVDELLDYVSKCTFYGNCIEAINIGKLIDLGLEKKELIIVIRQWLLQMFSNEYILFKNKQSILNAQKLDNPITAIDHNATNNDQQLFSPLILLTSFIRLYDTFIQNFDIIKTILRENSHSGEGITSTNNNPDLSMESSPTQQNILNPLFVQFTINSYNEYYSHKSTRTTHPMNNFISKITIPTVMNCLIYSERYNDIKLFMLESDDGALPDLIIMNLPYLWSRGGKQFKCHICENLYTRKYGLKIHLRTHNNNKPLKCEICMKAFRDPSNLVKHAKIHTKYNRSSSDARVDHMSSNNSSGYVEHRGLINPQASRLNKRPRAPTTTDPTCTSNRKRSSSYITP